MRILKAIFDFYINSSVHVSFAVLSMACVTFLQFEIPLDWNLLFFIFFASITGYNFVKYYGMAKFHHRRLAGWLQFIQIFSFISFVLMCFFGAHLSTRILSYIGLFAIVTFLYAIPFLPKNVSLDLQKNLRSVSGLKIYVIAVVWAGVTVLLPLLNYDSPIDVEVWLTTFQRFIIVIVLILPFEIRDLQYDSLKLSTIPQKIGVRKTKVMGIVLGILFLILEFLKEEFILNQIIISAIVTVVTMVVVIFSKREQNTYYSSFWVEGIPMLWLLLMVVF